MLKVIIGSSIGADRYQKLILKILLLSPPLGELCRGVFTAYPGDIIGGPQCMYF